MCHSMTFRNFSLIFRVCLNSAKCYNKIGVSYQYVAICFKQYSIIVEPGNFFRRGVMDLNKLTNVIFIDHKGY